MFRLLLVCTLLTPAIGVSERLVTFQDLKCSLNLPGGYSVVARNVGRQVVVRLGKSALQIIYSPKAIPEKTFQDLASKMKSLLAMKKGQKIISEERQGRGYRIVIENHAVKHESKSAIFLLRFEKSMYRLQFTSAANDFNLASYNTIAASLVATE